MILRGPLRGGEGEGEIEKGEWEGEGRRGAGREEMGRGRKLERPLIGYRPALDPKP